jgi:hypothetical protein
MNAVLIEETEDNFSEETIPAPEVVAAGDPRSKTWIVASFAAGGSLSTGV